MTPKHKNPTNSRRTAVAPYNFVAVPDKVLSYEDQEDNPRFVDQGKYHGNRLTGWIDVTMETRSPVYVRGSLTPAEYDKQEREEKDPDNKTPHLLKVRNKPDFFNVGDADVPVIPGSGVRGMLRTLAQILSYGKLAPVSDTPLAFRALADMSSQGEAYRTKLMYEEPDKRNHFTPRFKAGYIDKEGGRWVIRPAAEINGTTYARIYQRDIPRGLNRWHGLKNAQEIFIEPGPYKFQKVRGGFLHVRYARVLRVLDRPAPGLIKGALARSGKMFKKNSEAVVFPPDAEANAIPIPDGTDEDDARDLVTAYRNQISPEQVRLLGNRDGALQKHQPVFYLMEEGRLVFFGHTQMFRMVYKRSPREMLHPDHRKPERTDLAEAVFGSAKGQQSGKAGRVFVSDAVAEKGQTDIWLVGQDGVIPEILSSPKPTTFQHYLTQSRPDEPDGKGLHDYNASPAKTTLRGFKLYWHQGDTALDAFKAKGPVDVNKDTQHTRIRPVRSGVRFRFRIRFENLLLDELGMLWRTLDLPTDGVYAHKLGMGKPLGLGAVRLTPTLTLVSTAVRYRTLFGEDDAWETAVAPADLTEKLRRRAVTDFEKLIVDFARERNVKQFARLERVKQLIAMMSWPGPQPPAEKTRYMEIERRDPQARRGKRNEYRERPVLPDPTHT